MNKNNILRDLADLVAANQDQIIEQNQLDCSLSGQLDATLVDRLKVDTKKVKGMIASIEEVIQMKDPENELLYEFVHANGMLVQNRVVPFGNILIIYESRPDVTIEAAISTFKAGNKIYLKGGKEARNTNMFLVSLWHKALEQNGVPKEFVTYLDVSRKETQRIIRENPYKIDLIIPRGGEGLINYIRNNTSIPLLVSGRGNNFAYIHEDADFDMAINIILNGKSRLSVCNALDKVILDANLPEIQKKTVKLIGALQKIGIEVYVTNEISIEEQRVHRIKDESIFYEEFLAPKILLDITSTLPDAIAKINCYSGGHSATIICKDKSVAMQFQKEVDCAAVYHNASTRFTDGGQFGFGAEIAISTQKLHFRGPVGVNQLVTNKWYVFGEGQVRN